MLTRIRKAQENEAGFTLIELLVVMIIIGILAAIAIPTFLNQRKKGWKSAIKSDIHNASIAEEAYATDHDGLYADGATLLADTNKYNPTPKVTLTITGSGTSGYNISGVHSSLGSCTITFASSTGQLTDNC